MKVSVNIVYFPGTNCHKETSVAFARVGAVPRIIFITEVLRGDARLDDADILCIPGGFSYGDHVRAGFLAGLYLKSQVIEQLYASRVKPMLCICNGFQIAVEAGLFGSDITLTMNERGTFRNAPDQQHIVAESNESLWLRGLQGAELHFPCAHGEGRFIYKSKQGWLPALYYPSDENPDGSTDDIAGITSPDGMIFALMNHPERAIRDQKNLEIFRNAVQWVSSA